MNRKRLAENQILVTGEQVDLNTPENKVGRNLISNVMKKIKSKIVIVAIAVFSVAAFVSCEKSENNYAKDDDNGKPENFIENTKEAPPGGILIRRKFDWKITINPNLCEVGKGLCISGYYPPVPVEEVYEGILYKHPESENQIIFFFTDEYIEAEDELIDNGKFIIDIDIDIDEEMSNYVGFENSIKIKSGEYQINQDEAGWHIVIVDTE